jgi:hypothetical protein
MRSVIADALANIEAVGIRQHDIQQDEIGANAAAEVERATPGLRTSENETLFFQVVFKERKEIGIVFDQYYSFCHGTFSVPATALQRG